MAVILRPIQTARGRERLPVRAREAIDRSMDSIWHIAYLTLAGTALAQGLLLLLQAWEHRRFARSCMRTLGQHRPSGRAMVLAPCKGFDIDLEDHLRALLRQDYDDYEVTFIVESADDSACPVIRRIMAEHPRAAVRLLVAGKATDCGQKVHNLRAATAQIPPGIHYLAFADSDAHPRRDWLRLAVARLYRPALGATTGYRWFIPGQPSLANHLLYSINSNLMSLLNSNSHYLLWGGSWAISRDTFDAIGLHAAWEGTLSDDLVASRQLRRVRRYVRFEPACVMASPIDHSFQSMFSFIRRQYLIGRYYAPRWWLFALVVATVRNLAWPATLAAIVCSLVQGAPPLWVPLSLAGAMYLAYVGRGWLMQGLAREYFPQHWESLRAARRFDLWCAPLAGMVHWLALVSSIFGRHITWRNIRYRLYRHGRVTLERRDAELRETRPETMRRAA
jgi:ceramide glucosyltransferase